MGAARRRWALALAAAAAAGCFLRAGAFTEGAGEDPPPFFDYDCDLAGTLPNATADWNAVYDLFEARVVKADNKDFNTTLTFDFPERFRHLINGPLAPQAEEECPLGVLYLCLLDFYKHFSAGIEHDTLLPLANRVQHLLRKFPTYAIALSRWPVFYALEHFEGMHPNTPDTFCDGQTGVLDWAELRAEALHWIQLKRWKRNVADEEIETLERSIADKFFTILRRPQSQQDAQEECEFGFYFLVANQVVAAASRETHHMPPFNKVIDFMLTEIPFIKVAASGWPIYAVLVIFADLNKGIWFFGGDRKYLRSYSDWDLRADELSPLVPSTYSFLSPEYRELAGTYADRLAHTPATEFPEAVYELVQRREEVDGPMRPILRDLVEASLAVAAACNEQPSKGLGREGRRLAYVVLLYGKKWARILERLAGRLRQLRARYPLFVIAIGEDAANSCKALSSGGIGVMPKVVCWVPASQSQVHRFTGIHALLHLGIDVIYVDMDTFLLRDPTDHIIAQAEEFQLDAIFARHADADCINIGVFHLRAGNATAIWMSQYLAWYHDHPFEIDQRGLHIFLGLKAQQLSIAYRPHDLVRINGGVLNDTNEVVIGDVGWAGHISRMFIFHWCHRPIEQKEEEIGAAYDAADAVEAYGLPLSVGVSVAGAAEEGSGWAKVKRFRDILENYQLPDPPERTPCW